MHKIENKISMIFCFVTIIMLELKKKLFVLFKLDLNLKEYKVNEKELLKILTEVAVTRSEAEMVLLKF